MSGNERGFLKRSRMGKNEPFENREDKEFVFVFFSRLGGKNGRRTYIEGDEGK